MKFHRFLDTTSLKQKLHSSGQAQARYGESIGAGSSKISYKQRRAIDKTRSFVGRYRHSVIAQGHKTLKPNDAADDSPAPPTNSLPSTPGPNVPSKTQFREPSSRGYNPYK